MQGSGRHPTGERTITDLLEERVAADPGGAFLVFEAADGSIATETYGGFHARVLRAAAGFAALGVGAGDCVATQLRNSEEQLITLFALAHLGAIFVPSNIANTAAELTHVLEVSGARLVVTEPRFVATVAEACGDGVELVVARGDAGAYRPFAEIAEHPGPPPPAATDPVAVLELIFTSGTTSRPKAVMLTNANCVRAGLDAVHSLWLTEGERCITALPLFHVNAQAMSLFAAMTVGGTLILLEEFRASRFWSQVRSHRATQTAIVAMQLRVLLAQPPAATDRDHHLRRVFFAINVPDAVKDAFEERFGVALINGYGLSEAMTLCAVAPIAAPRRWPSVGLPAPGRVIQLLDDAGREVAAGEVGEVVVHGVPGRSIMLGYYGDEEATRQSIRDGRLFTGDNAYADEQGYLYFFDRKKDVIKRAGENISALEVEAVLCQHPAVVEVAVVGVPDPIRDESVAAAVVLVAGAVATSEELVEHCAARLAAFKVPTTIRFVDALPKTSIGKVQKRELRAQLAAEVDELSAS